MSVMELQSKFFPIQPRGTLISSATGVFPVTPTLYAKPEGEDKPLIKLREPRDLYSTTSLQHPPKWPIECQVIPEKIRHIETAPAKLEQFYVSSGSEPQPKPVGEEMGTVIYDYQPKLSVDYFCRSCVGGSEDLQAFETPDANTLKFESRFESGNLAKAIKVTNVYYELHLRQDMYTDRHSQWFYFRIQNTRENLAYRFSIVNFNKADSLYRYGLKVLMYSEKEAQLNKVGWVRCGQNISYFKNDCSSDENGMLYTLSFNLKFKHNNDTVYLAHCYPYTYSTLQSYLRDLEEDSFKSQVMTVRLLARSLAGNNVYVVTVTSPDNYLEESVKKPVIFLSARVHPGETQSSYMMKGIIDFLTSNCPQAQELRDRFIFKLIPMINPDGVIVGNSRCCLLGLDLNRQYRTVLREAFPQIYHAKVLLRRLVEENGVFLYCDIHGHSRRNNVFIYGCENRKFPEKRLVEQIFPLMMHKNAADKFSFQNCKFRVQKNKEGTGRVFAWTLGIVNSYTLEISLGGSTMPSRQYTHFNTADYEAVGRHFCETLMDFSDPSPKKEQLRDKILSKLTEGGSNADEPVNVPLTDYSSLSHSETEAENSCDEDNKEELVISISKKSKIVKKRFKPIGGVVKEMIRPPLALNKTSVDIMRLGQSATYQKQGDLIETSITREIALFKRLTKFRRKPNWPNKPALSLGISERDMNAGKIVPKCTSILFDDPFNPPGGFDHKRFKDTGDVDEEYEDSGSEDECDERDGTIRNKAFAQTQSFLTEEFSLLSLSGSTKSTPPFVDKQKQQSVTQTQTTLSANPFPKPRQSPFTPRLPEGKPLLRSFYSIDYEDTSASRFILRPPLDTGRRASLSTIPKFQQTLDKKSLNDSPRKPSSLVRQRVFRPSPIKDEQPPRVYSESKSQKHKNHVSSNRNRSTRQSFLTKSKSVTIADSSPLASSMSKNLRQFETHQNQNTFLGTTPTGMSESSANSKLKSHGHSFSKKKGKSKGS